MKTVEMCKILSNTALAEGIYDMTFACPDISAQAKPGQFVEIYPDNGANLLARPISICEIKDGAIRVVFQKIGKGTELFSKLKPGDTIRVLGPCGNGYNLKEGTALLVGGGIGVPPLLEACKQLSGEKTVVLGFRSGSFLTEEFEKYGASVYISTDDGSVGFKGNVVDLIKEKNITAEHIYSCGPKIMLKFLSQLAMEKNIDTQVSMEERMACGIGACVGCVVKIKSADGWEFKKVCKDGPVFDCKEVAWNE